VRLSCPRVNGFSEDRGLPEPLGLGQAEPVPGVVPEERFDAVRPFGRLLGAADVEGLAARGATGHNVNAAPTLDKLHLLGELAGSGRLRVPIQEVYPLERAADAMEAFQRGTRGKLIIRP
jgi:hypothetical protein